MNRTSNTCIRQPTTKPKLGIFVYLLAFMAVIGGFLFGYDTGIISSTMLFLVHNKGMRPMSTLWKEMIVSITPGMAAFGSLFAAPATDYFGRKKVILASSIVFILGAISCTLAPEKVTLFIGRLLLGCAIGFASMTVPIYVGEASPVHIRGILLTGFQLMITFGLMASNIIAGGFSYIDPVNTGWRLIFAFAAVPAIIQFIGFLFLPESPRWLYKMDRKEEAHKVLSKIYNGEKNWITYEINENQEALENERKALETIGDSMVIERILKTSHVRKALFIGCSLQAFQQFSGINTIMYYTGTIIQASGIQNPHTAIWISAAISSINFFATFMPMYLIERIGRRLLLFISMAGVILALLAMGAAFVLINHGSAPSLDPTTATVNSSVIHYNYCQALSNCDHCVTEEKCGFCQPDANSTEGLNSCYIVILIKHLKSYCLPYSHEFPDQSLTGPCENRNLTSVTKWEHSFCPSEYTFLPIIVMVFYLAFFSIGYAPMPWVLNAEFYPIWARSTCCGLSTSINWTFNLIISLTFLSLTQAVNKYGAFFIYAGITCFAFVFFFFVVPETKGHNIDEIELLFMSRDNQRQAKMRLKARSDASKNHGTVNLGCSQSDLL
ncbi:unnamed protein product [Thelazia callipaeda]|uniref:MFS domain-containing protein n=1 Tax=Thelazia callipaeda TaxID=103827 RepID=A0A0N5CPX1_THECL|nr:unnamed protein product [Thelazia callipaeda]